MTALAHATRALVASATVMMTLVVAAPAAAADDVRDDQWWIGSMKLSQAHRITKGAGVTVAVIDTGVWAGHPDLAGAVIPGADFTASKSSKDGRLDWDGHGTAVAGLIAARGRSGGRGLLGVAPEATVLPLRVSSLGKVGGGGHPGQAIQYAVTHGARVVNMSFGAGDGFELREAVQAAAAADVVLVAASGNTSEKDIFPAAYPEVVAVGAVDRKGALAKLSVTGPQLDLAAPGAGMVTLYRDKGSGYANDSGTSYSSAIVAGAAALVRAKFPDLSAAEVIHRLQGTAVDKGAPGVDPQYGHGLIDIVAALTQDVPPLVAASSAAPGNAEKPTAAGQPSQGRSNTAITLLGVAFLGALVLAGAAVTYHVIHRRRRSTTLVVSPGSKHDVQGSQSTTDR
jgi:type VII secretion-associated serine protease mycosin